MLKSSKRWPCKTRTKRMHLECLENKLGYQDSVCPALTIHQTLHKNLCIAWKSYTGNSTTASFEVQLPVTYEKLLSKKAQIFRLQYGITSLGQLSCPNRQLGTQTYCAQTAPFRSGQRCVLQGTVVFNPDFQDSFVILWVLKASTSYLSVAF